MLTTKKSLINATTQEILATPATTNEVGLGYLTEEDKQIILKSGLPRAADLFGTDEDKRKAAMKIMVDIIMNGGRRTYGYPDD